MTSLSHKTPDLHLVTTDIQMHSNSRIHQMLNGCYKPNDEDLQFLSTEEKECLRFFENTIDSLEEGFDDDPTGYSSRRTPATENIPASFDSSPSPVHTTNVSSNMMEHDIIDLVHSPSSYTTPDFRSLAVSPESHFEIKPKRDSVASNNSVTTTSSDASEENSHQPPPGSIPTPVVIASKIAEHQGSGVLTPSTLLEHRRSMESKRDPNVVRPSRLPSNISITRGARDTSPHSIASAAVNLQERRNQMLANLPAGAHPLEGGEPACVRNLPTRSMSFKDPTPDQSRIEALAKLGLTGGSTTNWSTSSVSKVSNSTTKSNNNATKVSNSALSASHSPTKVISNANLSNKVVTEGAPNAGYQVSNHISATHLNLSSSEPKHRGELFSSNINNFGGNTGVVTSAARDTVPPAIQKRNNSIKPGSAEVTHTNFNSYGGKSLVLNPSTSLNAESRVIMPQHADVPDGLHSTHNYVTSSPISPTTHHNDPNRFRVNPGELNNYDAKPKSLSPNQAGTVNLSLFSPRSSTLPSTTTRPQSVTKSVRPRPDPVPPEILSKPAPSFRSQSVTVQFSGKGVTSDARHDALRRLGLLKKPS